MSLSKTRRKRRTLDSFKLIIDKLSEDCARLQDSVQKERKIRRFSHTEKPVVTNQLSSMFRTAHFVCAKQRISQKLLHKKSEPFIEKATKISEILSPVKRKPISFGSSDSDTFLHYMKFDKRRFGERGRAYLEQPGIRKKMSLSRLNTLSALKQIVAHEENQQKYGIRLIALNLPPVN